MHEVLVDRLGSLSLPRKSVVRLTDRPDMTLDVYRGCKTTIQQQQNQWLKHLCNHENMFKAPYQGDSNEYTQITMFNKKKKVTQNLLNLQLCDFSKGLKNEFETVAVKAPSVFEPLTFYCNTALIL